MIMVMPGNIPDVAMVVIDCDSLTEGKKIMDTITPEGHRLASELLDQAAELAWKIATSGIPQIERYDARAFKHVHELVDDLYQAAYPGDSREVFDRVRELLADGPDNGYNGAPAELRGVAELRWGALHEQAERRAREARDSFSDQLAALVAEAMGEFRAAHEDSVTTRDNSTTTEAEFVRDLRDIAREQIDPRHY